VLLDRALLSSRSLPDRRVSGLLSSVARSRIAALVRALALTATYVLVARAGLAMDAVSGFASLVWPPTGLAIAALTIWGVSVWPAVAVGAFVANVWVGAPVLAALGIALGNTLEAVAGAWVLRRSRATIDDLRGVLALIIPVAAAATMISATIGVFSLTATGKIDLELVPRTFVAWWIGDAIGAIVLTPFLLSWWASDARLGRERWLEAIVFGSSLSVVSLFVFGLEGGVSPLRQAYVLFPWLIWAAFRFGQRGATLSVIVISIFAIAGTAVGRGPFGVGRLSESLIYLQSFMAIAAATTLLLGALTSELKRARAEAAQAHQAAEKAVQLRDDFIAVASHELRTPLMPLKLQLELLGRLLEEQEMPADRRDKADKKITVMLRQVDRLAQQISALLDFSRMRAGRLVVERSTEDLSEIVKEAVERIEETARAKISIRSNGPVSGSFDRLRLDQVVTNLVTNAIKYGEGNPIEISIGVSEERVLLSVADGGMGIAREDLERIFGAFERASSARQHPGFGLGLYLVKEIVKAHGGTIEVESEVGAGSRFIVSLPRAERARERPPTEPQGTPPLSGVSS
jgi:signal transduction histidine kinase